MSHRQLLMHVSESGYCLLQEMCFAAGKTLKFTKPCLTLPAVFPCEPLTVQPNLVLVSRSLL